MTSLAHRGLWAEADERNTLAAFRLVAERRRLPEAIWYHDRVAAQRRILSGEFTAGKAACDALRARVQVMQVHAKCLRLSPIAKPSRYDTNNV